MEKKSNDFYDFLTEMNKRIDSYEGEIKKCNRRIK